MTYEMIAYEIGETEDWAIEPAPAKRDWMQQTPSQGAYRCLPLVMASQAGWIIRCPCTFKATWDGKRPAEGLKLEFSEDAERNVRRIMSGFGFGILTFSLPWLFRTSEGFGLLVRGPSNSFKEHAAPLDGLVETDWAPYTFTMNWKIIRPKTPVWFRRGEPICMIMPYPIAILEQFSARVESIESDQELFDEFLRWREQRRKQFAQVAETGDPKGLYRLDYVRGAKPDGTFANAHWSNLKLARFQPQAAELDES